MNSRRSFLKTLCLAPLAMIGLPTIVPVQKLPDERITVFLEGYEEVQVSFARKFLSRPPVVIRAIERLMKEAQAMYSCDLSHSGFIDFLKEGDRPRASYYYLNFEKEFKDGVVYDRWVTWMGKDQNVLTADKIVVRPSLSESSKRILHRNGVEIVTLGENFS